jgi:hypothetical protein
VAAVGLVTAVASVDMVVELQAVSAISGQEPPGVAAEAVCRVSFKGASASPTPWSSQAAAAEVAR